MSTSLRIEWVDDDDAWLEPEAGERVCDVVELDDDGSEISRTRTLVQYDPRDHLGTRTPGGWRDELAVRRSIARGAPVLVVGFAGGASVQLLDVDKGALAHRLDVPTLGE